MSFFTSLTGLNAATTQLSVTSNNIANAGTTGFKRSRSDFGDIFATSPLQKASTVVGQGTALKQVTQEFSQGNIELSGNSLDLAVTGEGFFPLRSADGQDLFTRNGSFLLDEQNTVVNSAGQFLKVASVDSLGKADFKADLIPLTIAPRTVGQAIATSNIDFAINFPAESLPLTTIDENNLEKIKPFNPNDSSTFAKSAAITIFDENGNDFLLTFYYRRIEVASSAEPFNKWQTHVVLDGQEITPALGQATTPDGRALFVDKYGNIVPEDELPVVLNDNLVFQKYNLDDLSDPSVSVPATARSGQVDKPYLSDESGVDFAPVEASTLLSIDVDKLPQINTTSAVASGVASDVITTAAAHGFKTGDRVTLSAETTAATGLVDNGQYYVIRESDTTFKLAASEALALAGTSLTISDAGAGAQTFTYNEEIKLTLTDGAATPTTLAMISSTIPAKATLNLANSGDVEAGNIVSLKLTGADGVEETLTTPALAVDSTASDLVTALNTLSAAGQNKYVFSVPADSSGDLINPSQILITRADGVNFKLATAAGHSLSGNAALFENISAASSALGTTSTALTTNGLRLDSTATVPEIIDALHRSSSSTDFEVAASATATNGFIVSNHQGIDFQVRVDRLPNGADQLLQGSVNGSVIGLSEASVVDTTDNGSMAPDLSRAFDITVDEDPDDVNATQALTVDLSVLTAPENASLSGDQVASLMTKEINRQFGDQRYFNLSSDANRQFRMTFDSAPTDDVAPQVIDVVIPASAQYTEKSLAAEIQSQLRAATGTHINVQYSRSSKGFVFTPETTGAALTIRNVPGSASLNGSAVPNTLFGLNTLSSEYTLDSRGRYAAEVIPNGDEILPRTTGQQRYGVKVEFLPNTDEGGTGGKFAISSGKTGDDSAIRIENVSAAAKEYFGFDSDDPTAILEVVAESGSTAVRGVESTAARVFGRPVSVDPDETFLVDDLSNEFTVTVDNVTETFRLPVGNYNLNSFKTALQNRINAMEDSRGNSISGVVVNFDQVNDIFTFTSGTKGDSSFFQISGSSRYGLEGIDSSVGQTSTYRPPVSEQTVNDRPIYVTKDENGVFREFSTDVTSGLDPLPGSREFTTDPEYRPLFLDKGELTFDTAGNLISPRGGISLDNVVIGGSGNTLNIDIDYAGSTQFSGDFSVNSQSQNGQPNGSLVAVDIADDGLVTASYSNGTQDLKGKIVLATFSTPNGLRQLGDSTFLESNESGTPALGEPGGAGFGTIRAGARERANVDLTSELVDLITAQRNFQANAKAIETSSTLTSTIINIRS
jgi:flagellar hook-basal body protein